jgi:hypothetical protein
MSTERRTEIREPLVVPLQIGSGISGVTRDISAAGAFVETDFGQPLDSLLTLEFSLDSVNARFKFVAEGSVLRHECCGQTQGVAVKLLALRMLPA